MPDGVRGPLGVLTWALILALTLSPVNGGLPGHPRPDRSIQLSDVQPPPPNRTGWVNETASLGDSSPAPLAHASAVFDPNGGTATVFGGLGARGVVSSSTWIFDDGNWENITPYIHGSSPPALYGAALTFDGSDGYVLLFGGQTAHGEPYGGTWSWSAGTSQWTNRTTSMAPPPGSGSAMAYDPVSGQVVLIDPGSILTWTYHAGVWSSHAQSPSPAPRSGEVMVTDTTENRVYLVGGEIPARGIPLNDTWSYSGGVWTLTRFATSPPPPLWNATAVDHPFLQGVFLVGTGPGSSTQSWTLTNPGWTEIAPSNPDPPARSGATLVYDSSGAVILCGGTDPSGARFLNDCWTWGAPKAPPNPLGAAAPLNPAIVAVGILLIAVPVGVAAFLKRRPPRPDLSRVPAPAPS
ncbi:MAG: kelch repeat-containing protein [Thermoplasmata archaeon]|nr:kelch repeat-containing protein [Thermoplasmata archaeon]MCI4359736.1 kelch repeat-containing protein [Thermoplasmata archaeon]